MVHRLAWEPEATAVAGIVDRGPGSQPRTLSWLLGSSAGDDARQALRDLLDEGRLSGWRSCLRHAWDHQTVIHRDARYRYRSSDSVQMLLDNGPPADAADLAALVVDRLHEMREDIGGGNSNLWRQFWNEDRYGRAAGGRPKHENSCRDALLAMLQGRLPVGVDAVPEGRYAADRRADIRVSYGGFNVPIEIKKSSHPRLWDAAEDQLAGRYTTDPGTGGHGIYVVLWFGDVRAETGSYDPAPAGPQELERRLRDRLDDAGLGHRITVVTLDVTPAG